MFRFQLEADSMLELTQKMDKWAKAHLGSSQVLPEYIDEVPEPVRSLPEVPVQPVVLPPAVPVHTQESVAQAIVNGPAPVAGGSDLDSRGLPYDTRIHASSKATTKDGSWRYKRGITDEEIAKVEAELRSKQPIASAASGQDQGPFNNHAPQQPANIPTAPTMSSLATPPPPAPTVPVATPTFADRNVATPFDNVVPIAAVQPVQAAPAVQPQYQDVQVPAGQRPVHSYATFKENLPNIVAQLINEGKLTQEYIAKLCTYFNIKHIWNVLASEAQCLELYNSFGQWGYITKMD